VKLQVLSVEEFVLAVFLLCDIAFVIYGRAMQF
jgi:hypothetical protein